MRSRVTGFVVSTLLFTAVAGLTAPPTFATDYFVKYLNEASSGACPQTATGPRHGSVVFRRTSASMFATIYLRNATPNTTYVGSLFRKERISASCLVDADLFTTDGNGNATVVRGPLSRQGGTAFWVRVDGESDGEHFGTAQVPAFGF